MDPRETVPGQTAQPLYTPSELGHQALLELKLATSESLPECSTASALTSIACSQARIGMFLEQLCLELHDLVQELKTMNGGPR